MALFLIQLYSSSIDQNMAPLWIQTTTKIKVLSCGVSNSMSRQGDHAFQFNFTVIFIPSVYTKNTLKCG